MIPKAQGFAQGKSPIKCQAGPWQALRFLQSSKGAVPLISNQAEGSGVRRRGAPRPHPHPAGGPRAPNPPAHRAVAFETHCGVSALDGKV